MLPTIQQQYNISLFQLLHSTKLSKNFICIKIGYCEEKNHRKMAYGKRNVRGGGKCYTSFKTRDLQLVKALPK